MNLQQNNTKVLLFSSALKLRNQCLGFAILGKPRELKRVKI